MTKFWKAAKRTYFGADIRSTKSIGKRDSMLGEWLIINSATVLDFSNEGKPSRNTNRIRNDKILKRSENCHFLKESNKLVQGNLCLIIKVSLPRNTSYASREENEISARWSLSVLIVSLHNTGRLTVCSKSPAVHVVCNEEFEPSEYHHNNKGSDSRD